MSGNQIVLQHLNAARVELEDQRDTAVAGIADIDAMIQRYAAAPDTHADARRCPAHQYDSITTADSILNVLRKGGSAVRALDIVSAVERETGASDASVRSQLVKMRRSGRIEQVSRGMYRLPPDTETPAATGVSVGNTPSDQEGGGSLETNWTSQGDRGNREIRDDHHHLGASVTEVAD